MSTTTEKQRQGIFVVRTGQNVAFTFVLVSSLFLLWGFCNGMIDTMDKHFQDILHLTLAQSANVQFAHYVGYFLMALPAGWFAAKLGYRAGIIAGLLLVAAGGAAFYPVTHLHVGQLPAVMLAVATIAAGLTFLETIANPYTTVLGATQYAAVRINLAQSCNGIGWILGPLAASRFFYAKQASGAAVQSDTLWIPYVGVAIVVVILAVVFTFAPVPDLNTEDDYHLDDSENTTGEIKQTQSIWTHGHFLMAIAAQFFYVAAQSGIFAFMINYLISETPAIPASLNHLLRPTWTEPDSAGVVHFSKSFASLLASVGFMFFLLGRFTGSALLQKVTAHKLLGLYALLNVIICGIITAKLGWISVAAVFVSYFLMSIMFPTIFALGIFGLGTKAKQASGFIVLAIMGGATVPKLMGYIADKHGMSAGYFVPMVCFIVVAVYGFAWPRLSGFETMSSAS